MRRVVSFERRFELRAVLFCVVGLARVEVDGWARRGLTRAAKGGDVSGNWG